MSDYNYGHDGYDDGQDTYGGGGKSLKGYKIIIIVLAVILAALSFLYFNQVNTLKKEYAVERDTLTNRITMLMHDYDELTTSNDTLAHNLGIERLRADSLLQSLASERNLSRAKIRSYEKELGTLRAVMQNYVKQIDSLNTLNQELIRENVGMKQEMTSVRLRAETAEETAAELSTKIRKGAVIRARDIRIRALNNRDNEVRATRATRLRIDFVLSSNELATPGARDIYVRITGPDDYLLANSAGAVFDYEGEKRTYSAMREVDYQNDDLGVSIFYNDASFAAGKYAVQIYTDGYLLGSTEVILK